MMSKYILRHINSKNSGRRFLSSVHFAHFLSILETEIQQHSEHLALRLGQSKHPVIKTLSVGPVLPSFLQFQYRSRTMCSQVPRPEERWSSPRYSPALCALQHCLRLHWHQYPGSQRPRTEVCHTINVLLIFVSTHPLCLITKPLSSFSSRTVFGRT